MKLGLVGAGRIGSRHAGVILEHQDVGELLIYDAVPDRAIQVAAGLDGARAAGLDELLGSSEAVIIASPTDTHAEMLKLAAAARVPAFCEKPIDLDLAKTREAVEQVEEAGIKVLMGFQRRYDPAIKAISQRAAVGELGRLFLVRSQTHDPSPPPIDYILHSGGIFKDCLIHDIDAVRFVTGQEVVAVSAAGSSLGHDEIGELGDMGTASAVLEMSGGTLGQISGLRLDPVGYDARLEVFAEKDSVAAGWSPRTPIISAEPGVDPPIDPIKTFWGRFDAAYRAEMRAFVRIISGEEEPASTPRDAYQDLRVAAACDWSVQERRTVAVEEVGR